MSKHTPGPWSVNGRSIDSTEGFAVAATEGVYRRPKSGRGSLDAYPDEQEANARLIAKAPEMRELLQRFLNSADATGCSEGI